METGIFVIMIAFVCYYLIGVHMFYGNKIKSKRDFWLVFLPFGMLVFSVCCIIVLLIKAPFDIVKGYKKLS